MTTAILEKKLKRFERPYRSAVVRRMLSQIPARPITSRASHAYYRNIVNILMEAVERGAFAAAEKREVEDYIGVVAREIAAYERTAFPVKDASAAEVLAFLMEEHGLTQQDLAEDLGGQPAVSYVLNGKRDLNKDQIAKLCARFHVSPEVFFPTAR